MGKKFTITSMSTFEFESCRVENAWKSYWSMKSLMKGDLPLSLKHNLIDMCILPILTGQGPSLSTVMLKRDPWPSRKSPNSRLAKGRWNVAYWVLSSATEFAIPQYAQKLESLMWAIRLLVWSGIGRATSVECIRTGGPESSRSGCQKTGVIAEGGLENAGVTT